MGEQVNFAGSATDAQDGPLGATSMEWSLDLEHCPGGCHTHAISDFATLREGPSSSPTTSCPRTSR